MCVYWRCSGGDPTPVSIMTLFQTHKLIKIDGREDFWMPHGPAFFTKAEADQFHADNFTGEQFQVFETAPLGC